MAFEFPAFLKLEHRGDGSARSSFLAEVDNITSAASRKFEAFGSEAQRQLQQALTLPRTDFGSLNLGAEQARRAAQAAQAQATAAREIATATRLAAQEAGDFSQEARQAVAASEALAREQEQAATAARSHAAALGQVQAVLDRNRSSVDAAAIATGRHASMMSRAANENGAYRASMINAGQQLQDFAIQIQGGQRVSTALAQQLPQLSYALSGLADSSNKTAARIGAVATTLSGPLGVGVVIGVAALGSLIGEFFKTGDAAEGATKQTFDFTRGLDVLKLSATDAKDAMAQLAQEIRGAIVVQGDFLQQKADLARSSRVDLEGKLQRAVSDLEKEKGNIGRFTLNPVEGLNRADRIGKLQASIEEYRNALDSARTAEAAADIALSQQRIAEATDASTAATGRFNREVGKLVTEYERAAKLRLSDPLADATNPGLITKAEFDRRMAQLTAQKEAAVAAARAAQRTSTSLPAVTGSEVARLIGAPITSGTRTPAQNAAAKGAANSYHLSGQAIDIPLTVNGRPLTKAGIRAALEPAGIVIKELLGPGDKGHDDHFHVAFDKRRRGADQVADAAQRAQEAMARLGEFASDTAAKVDGIGQSFGETPTMIARANTAMKTLLDLADDVDQRLKQGLDPTIAAKLKSEIAQTMAIVADAPQRPWRDFLKADADRAATADLLMRGRVIELETRRQIVAIEEKGARLDLDQIEAIRMAVVEERQRTAQVEKQNALRQRNVQLIETTEANLRGAFQGIAAGGGIGSIGAALKDQFKAIRVNAVDNLFDGLLGQTFADARDRALGFDKVREASLDQVKAANATRDALDKLAQAATTTAAALSPTPAIATGTTGAAFAAAFGPDYAKFLAGSQPVLAATTAPGTANDNTPGTVVDGLKSPRQVLGDLVMKAADAFLDPATAKRIGDGFANGLSSNASAFGMLGGGLVNGGKNSALGSAIGGALGKELGGEVLGKGLKAISGSLGSLGGPLASILGGVLGGVLGGLLKPVKTGTATIGSTNGALGVTGTGGNSASRIRAASGAADTIVSSMDRIAEALGGRIDASVGAVSIGIRDKSYRVDPTGQGITRKSRGAINFGSDSEAAMKAATLDLLQDGVIAGIRASTQRLISAGKDLDSALRKATDFEGVFQSLRERTDPVGAALDTLDRKFVRLQSVFAEAGASAGELADLEKEYAYQRADAVKAAMDRAAGSLKGLLSDLNIGDRGLSLRDRLANAQSVYNPLLSRVKAGDVTAFDSFAEAAQDVLGISRELYGSQSEYFQIFTEIRGVTQGALDAQQAIADAAAGRDSPFSKSSVATQDNASVVSAIDKQTQALVDALGGRLDAVNDNLGGLLANTARTSAGVAGWSGTDNF